MGTYSIIYDLLNAFGSVQDKTAPQLVINKKYQAYRIRYYTRYYTQRKAEPRPFINLGTVYFEPL